MSTHISNFSFLCPMVNKGQVWDLGFFCSPLLSLLMYNYTTASSSLLAAPKGRAPLQVLVNLRGRRQGQPTARRTRRAGEGGARRSRGQLLEAAPGLLPMHRELGRRRRPVGAPGVAPAAHPEGGWGLAVETPPAATASWPVAAGPTTATRGTPRPPAAASLCRSPSMECEARTRGTRTSSPSSVWRLPWWAPPSPSSRCCCRRQSGKTKLHFTTSSGSKWKIVTSFAKRTR